MSVGRVGMFNFFTEADCEKFIAMHTTKVPELLERGLLEITWVRASPESVLMFVIFYLWCLFLICEFGCLDFCCFDVLIPPTVPPNSPLKLSANV